VSLFLHILVSPFKTQARLEAEISVLRRHLNVLRQQVPSKPRLTVADRVIFVWLYRLFPTVLSAMSVIGDRAGDRHSVASDRLPAVLALEVALSWRSAEDTPGRSVA
jgi:hypothetical protein